MINDTRKMNKNIRISVVDASKKILFKHELIHEPALSPISRKMVKVIKFDVSDLLQVM